MFPTKKNPEEFYLSLFSDEDVISGFQSRSLQFMMIKKIDDDTIVWCNDAAAKPLGVSAKSMFGKPSSDYYPDTFEQFHEDDLDVQASGEKLKYFEEFTASDGAKHQLVTNKWHVNFLGSSYIFIVSLDLTAIIGIARSTTDHGRSYDFAAIEECRHRFDELVAKLAEA